MAVLSDVYKTKNNREITLTTWQASIFDATIEKFKVDGVGGDDVFEETYVLQKAIAEYITGNLAKGGGDGEVPGKAVITYNAILGIESAAPVDPQPIPVPDPVTPPPLPESPLIPVKPSKPVGPRNIPFRDLRDPNRAFRPRTMTEFLANRGGGIKGGGTQAINTGQESPGISPFTGRGRATIKNAARENRRRQSLDSFRNSLFSRNRRGGLRF